MKTLLLIILCSLPLIGYGQSDSLSIENWKEHYLIVSLYENKIQQLTNELATAKEIIKVKDILLEVLAKKCREYYIQDSVRRSYEFQIKSIYPIMIEKYYLRDSLLFR